MDVKIIIQILFYTCLILSIPVILIGYYIHYKNWADNITEKDMYVENMFILNYFDYQQKINYIVGTIDNNPFIIYKSHKLSKINNKMNNIIANNNITKIFYYNNRILSNYKKDFEKPLLIAAVILFSFIGIIVIYFICKYLYDIYKKRKYINYT